METGIFGERRGRIGFCVGRWALLLQLTVYIIKIYLYQRIQQEPPFISRSAILRCIAPLYLVTTPLFEALK